jgi:hypothetical protein
MVTKKKGELKQEGLYFVAPNYTYKSPKVNFTELEKITQNKYIVEGLGQLQSIIFQDPVSLSVQKPKSKDIDEDLTASLQDMCSAKEVRLDISQQRAWRDGSEYGCGLRNPYWDYEENEFVLKKLNRLPPGSFRNAGNSMAYIYSRILPGIRINNTTNQTEYWQTQNDGKIILLNNVHVTQDPMSGELGGVPFILPLFPFVKMVNYSFQRQMQKVNIWGSGGLKTIKVTDPIGDDLKFAEKFLKNESATNRYPLRPNMEVVDLGTDSGTGSALETITELGMQFRRFFSPAGLVSKEGGSLIGGSNTQEMKLYVKWIRGIHQWLEWDIADLLDPWMVYNGWKAKGYKLLVDLPEPEEDRSELLLKIADAGERDKALDTLTKHQLLRTAAKHVGVEIEAIDEAGAALIDEHYKQAAPSPFGSPLMQKAVLATESIKANPLDPYSGVSRKDYKKTMQAALQLEEGQPVPFEGTPHLQADGGETVGDAFKRTTGKELSGGSSGTPKGTGAFGDKTKGHVEIDTIEKSIKSAEIENAAVYSKEGKHIISKVGTAHQVEFSNEEIKGMKDGIFTHNHPSSDATARTLSPTDYGFAVNADVSEMRAVHENKVFVFTRPEGGWPGVDKVSSSLSKNLKTNAERILVDLKAGKISKPDAENKVWAATWAQTSKEVGFGYTVRAVAK